MSILWAISSPVILTKKRLELNGKLWKEKRVNKNDKWVNKDIKDFIYSHWLHWLRLENNKLLFNKNAAFEGENPHNEGYHFHIPINFLIFIHMLSLLMLENGFKVINFNRQVKILFIWKIFKFQCKLI